MLMAKILRWGALRDIDVPEGGCPHDLAVVSDLVGPAVVFEAVVVAAERREVLVIRGSAFDP